MLAVLFEVWKILKFPSVFVLNLRNQLRAENQICFNFNGIITTQNISIFHKTYNCMEWHPRFEHLWGSFEKFQSTHTRKLLILQKQF